MSAIEPHTFHASGLPLSSMLAGSTTWERTLVPIEPAVRVMAATVAVLIGLVVLLQFTVHDDLSGFASNGFLLFGGTWFASLLAATPVLTYPYLVLLGLLAALATLTQGFAVAGRRLHRLVGGLVIAGLAGLALPLCMAVIALANLVAWVVVGLMFGSAAVAVLMGLADS